MTRPRPPAGPLRAEVERRSRVALVALSRQPKWLLPVVTVLLLVGVVVLPPGLALVCLALVVGLVAIVLAAVNMVGGFVVTDRMLQMFTRRKKPAVSTDGKGAK